MQKNTTVLLSGGIDSTCCIKMLSDDGYHVSALFVDYGQSASKLELVSATAVAVALGAQLHVVTVDSNVRFASGEIVGRNAFLFGCAMMYANIDDGLLAIGIHGGTPYYDCSPAFMGRIEPLVAETSSGRLHAVAPLLSWTKSEIYAYFRTTGIDPQITYSCEAGLPGGCGRCLSCLDRARL